MRKPLTRLTGQPSAVELLERAITTSKAAPAYLFVGAKGVGKAYAAKCFTEMLLISAEEDYASAKEKIRGGNHPDFLWVEPTYSHQGQLYTPKEAEEKGLKRKTAPIIRIEQIRQIGQFVNRPPLKGDRAVVVIDSAELMAESAGNALLKTLEEPRHATIILIAPSSDAILSTLVSRCQIIPFTRLSDSDLDVVLRREDSAEVLEYPQLMKLAQGCPGKAIADWQKWREIPTNLISRLNQLPENTIEGFKLAQEISTNLELDTQIWLADYLQALYWQKKRKDDLVQSLEKVKKALNRYVQPRLVWDCFFLANQCSIDRQY